MIVHGVMGKVPPNDINCANERIEIPTWSESFVSVLAKFRDDLVVAFGGMELSVVLFDKEQQPVACTYA